MAKILNTNELSEAQQVIVHKSALGDVAFVVPSLVAPGSNVPLQPLMKSFVRFHYRHSKDGKLIQVKGYYNKVMKQPGEAAGPDDQVGVDQPAQKDPNDKLTSYHLGDEVFVRYSHMHDQHFLVGAVIGIRDDASHAGKLVAVRLMDGRTEWYAPGSITHLSKMNNELRGHEVSHHTDDKGNPIAYTHLTDDQKLKFYDLYKLWWKIQRMSEIVAFQKNKQHFADENGHVPTSKSDLTAEQKIMLESWNPIPVVPHDGLIQAVAAPGYDNGKHVAAAKHLLEQIKTLKEQGAPDIQIPKIKKAKKSKKENPYLPAAWVQGMFPSTEEEVDKWGAKEQTEAAKEYDKLAYEIQQATGFKEAKPSTTGVTYGNHADFYYGKPIVDHGAVKEPEQQGTTYKPAAKVPSLQEATKTDFNQLFTEAEDKIKAKVAEKEKTSLSSVPKMSDSEIKKQVSAAYENTVPYEPSGLKSKIPAVKKYRELTGALLKDAVDYVDAIIAEHNSKQQKAEPEPEPTKAPLGDVSFLSKLDESKPPEITSGGKDISDLKFKVVGNAQNFGFGGAHSKYILDAGDGHQYLFKPFKESEAHRVWAEIIAAKLSEMVGFPSAEMGSKPISIKIPVGSGGSYAGKTISGSVQRVFKDIKKNNISEFATKGFANAPKELIEHLQREHVIDWLLGNHDAHEEQFVQTSDGKYVGIDKGQAFKHYGEDYLDITYDPNANLKLHEQVYNILLKSAKKGDVQLDYGVVASFIEQVQDKLSSMKWMAMVSPYAEYSAKWGNEPYKLKNLATKRLAMLSHDFKKLYQSVGLPTEYDKNTKAYKKAVAVPKEKLPETETFQPDAFINIDPHFHQSVMKAGAKGKSLLMGGGTIEDMNVLFTPYEWDNTAKKNGKDKGMEISCKVLAGAEPNMIGFFNTVQDQTVTYSAHNGALPADYDPVYGSLKLFAMTVNQHAPKGGKDPNGQYNEFKSDEFAKWFQSSKSGGEAKFDPNKPLISAEQLALKLYEKHVTDKNFEDPLTVSNNLAKYYLEQAQEIMSAVAAGTKTPKHYEPWTGDYKMIKSAVSEKKHPWATYPHFYLDNNNVLRRKIGEKKPVHDYAPSDAGVMFTKNLPGNIQIRYYPHHSNDLGTQNNLRSQQGQLIIDMDNWDGSVDSMHKARQIFKQMGLDHKLANHVDLECLALTRYAWQQKADVTDKATWKKIQAMKNSPEKVEALRKLNEKVYGIDLTKLPTYDPTPKWDGESSHHYFINPYVIHYLQNKPKMIFVPSHGFTSDVTSDSATKHLAHFGLLSTEQRLKYAMPYYGSSCTTDQKTGGAAYVFTRGEQKTPETLDSANGNSQLTFKPELMARSDWFAYLHDNYGSTNYGHQYDNKKSIETRLSLKDVVEHGQTPHEVMFKNSISLHPWLKILKGAENLKKIIKEINPHVFNHAKWVKGTSYY